MTVCIGALCEDGKSAVMAADKMVTFGPPMMLQTEPPVMKKITEITKQSVLLFSGPVPDGEALAKSIAAQFGATTTKQEIAKIAEAIKQGYAVLKRRKVEETILGPLLGVDYPAFQALLAGSAASQMLQQIMGMI